MKKQGTSAGVGCLAFLIVVGLIVWAIGKANESANTPEAQAAAAQKEAERQRVQKAREEAQAQAEKERAERFAKLREDAPTYTVPGLVAFYAGNELAGDEALKGKWFKVQGKIDRVAKDILGDSYLTLVGESSSIRTVQCFFDASHQAELTSVRPGDRVIIFGKGNGLMMNVLMERCEFVTK